MEVTDNNNRNPPSLLNSLHENQAQSPSPLIGNHPNAINILNPPTLNHLPFNQQNILNPLNQQPPSLNILNQSGTPLFPLSTLKQPPIFSSTPGSFSRGPLTINQSHSPLSTLHNPNTQQLHQIGNQISNISSSPNSSKMLPNISPMQSQMQILPNNQQHHTVINLSPTPQNQPTNASNPNTSNNNHITLQSNQIPNQKMTIGNGSQHSPHQSPQTIRQQPQKIIIPDDIDDQPEELPPASLKSKYNCMLLENWALLDQLEKYKKQVVRLSKEKNYLLDKLAMIDVIDENDVSDKEESDDEPPLKKRKLSTPAVTTRSRRSSKAETPSQNCTASTRGGIQCKSKAMGGSQFCWHHAPLDPNSKVETCQYRNKKSSQRCNLRISKDDPDGICNYHKHKLQSKGNLDDDKSQTLKSPSLLPSKPHPQLFSPTPEEEDEYEKEIDSD